MNFESAQAAETLREIEREAHRPSALFLGTVDELARQLGLDAGRIVAGEAILLRGMVFHLVHGGAADPEGLGLFIQLGPVPSGGELEFLQTLLEHNVSSPTHGGTYGLMPGTGTVVLRMRVDLAKSPAPAAHVLRHVEAFATQLEAVSAMTRAAVEAARRYPQDAAARA
jgi:hypothetical protein